MTVVCIFCRRLTAHTMCVTCAKAYDRRPDDGTVINVMEWAARRAWYFASKEHAKTKKALKQALKEPRSKRTRRPTLGEL